MKTVYRRGRNPRRPRVHAREDVEPLGIYPVFVAVGAVLMLLALVVGVPAWTM
jgi:hypothetical protein